MKGETIAKANLPGYSNLDGLRFVSVCKYTGVSDGVYLRIGGTEDRTWYGMDFFYADGGFYLWDHTGDGLEGATSATPLHMQDTASNWLNNELKIGLGYVYWGKDVMIRIFINDVQIGTKYAADMAGRLGTALCIANALDAPFTIKSVGDYKHTGTKTDAVPGTCQIDGYAEYWTCNVCGKLFSDEACKNEIDVPVNTGKGSHKLTPVAQKDATCTAEGTKAYWECGDCKAKFSDAEGKVEIEKPVTIAKHTAKPVKAVAATYTKTGMAAHYKCSCGKLYTDKACTKATTKAKLTVPVKKLTVAKTSVKSVTAKSKALAVKWTKKSGVTGYEVQVALKKNFKSGLKKATVKGAGKTTVTVKKLKAKKTYYVRVRAYKKVEGKTFYSAWSNVKSKKTK